MQYLSRLLLVSLCITVFLLGSCRKTAILSSGGSIRFSADTLLFDTVFTTRGSATYGIKIYNVQNQPIHISNVRLESGSNSAFKINVNGVSGGAANQVLDQELAAHDSLYVFSIVNVDPNSETSPFIVEDKLIVTLNNREFSVPVIAYGQNAHYLYDSVIAAGAVWDNTLPYVIIHNAYVDKGNTLTIKAGTRVYMHADSRLYMLGNLITEGTKKDSVIFQGDRLDRSYFSYLQIPGEWGGLYFTEFSTGNKLKWTVLKNCGNSTPLNGGFAQPAAIQVDRNPAARSEQLQMDNCIIQNSLVYGLLSFGGGVQMRNSMIHTCGSANVALFEGGNYEFDHCTFATYGTRFVSHAKDPVFYMLNYRDTSNTRYVPGDLKATITNCIIYGTLTEELVSWKKEGALFDARFSNCLVRAKEGIHEATVLTDCKKNEDPLFEDYAKWDFHLKEASPAVNAGNNLLFGQTLDDLPRNNNIGAY